MSATSATGVGDVPPEFARDCARFFAGRLQGPADARAAALLALEGGEPYRLAWTACLEGRASGLSRFQSRRLGFVAEVVRAALEICTEAYREIPLPTRIERARRVLVADTLLTFCYELAAEIREPRGNTVRRRLAELFGPEGFLGELASGSVDGLDPRQATWTFLEGVLNEMPASQRRGPTLEEVLSILRDQLPDLRVRYGMRRVGVFGSYVRGEERPTSDLDLLVEFDERPLTLLQIIALENQLSDVLGVKVDVVEESTLKEPLGERIKREVAPV